MKLFKRLVKLLVALVLVAVVAAVALVFLLDPNIFKPRLEAAARDQGLELSIDGNLGWQLWPDLGLEVRDLRLASLAQPQTNLMNLEQASLLLKTWPLLRGRLEVHHIRLQAPNVNLIVNEQGRGNWESLLPEATAEADAAKPDEPTPADTDLPEPDSPEADTVEDTPEAADSSLQLSVERISLTDAALNYRDLGTGQAMTLAPLNLDITGFNLRGERFDLALGWQAEVTDPSLGEEPLSLTGEISGQTTLAPDLDRMRLEQGQFALELARAGASDRLTLNLGVDAQKLLTEPSYRGQLSLEPFNPKKMLELLSLPPLQTQKPEAFTQLGLELSFAGDTTSLALDPVRLRLDDTRIEGSISSPDMERLALRADLSGDRMNLDDYFAPTSEEEAEPADGDQELISLEQLQALDLDFRLGFEALTLMDFEARDIELRVRAEDGLVTLEQAQLQAYEGEFRADGQVDGRVRTAELDFGAQLEGLQLAPLLRDLELDEDMQLTGALNSDIKGQTQGLSMNQLMDALEAEANFSGAEVRLAPLNIEQQFCQIMRLASRGDADPNPSWPDYTQLTELSGRALVRDQVVELEEVQAGVERLTLGVKGQVDLREALVDLTLPLRLGNEATSAEGCQVTSNYWINRSLSLLRCRGSLEAFNPARDCRPDKEGLAQLTKDYARFKLKDKAKGKVEEKRQKLEQKAKEKLGEDAVEGVRKLFGR